PKYSKVSKKVTLVDQSSDGEKLIAKSDCIGCHKIDKKLIGPSYLEIAKKYKVKIIKEKRQGIIFARNAGFNAVKYEIIARCDADTIVPKDWIKKIKQNFSDKNIDGLTGPAFFYDLPFPTRFFTMAYLKGMKIIQKGKNTLIGPNMAIRKKVWEKIKNKICLDDKKVHEDIDLAIHISQVGGKIYLDDNLVVKISARRIKNNPTSFFIEYPIRLIKTLAAHQ
ncbi:MAG: glycosyltransferase, partial [Microgenomates group bacterium]